VYTRPDGKSVTHPQHSAKNEIGPAQPRAGVAVIRHGSGAGDQKL